MTFNIYHHLSYLLSIIKAWEVGELRDGRGVRRGDHLLPYKYIKNTSTCGTAPTEHILNTGRRPQTSKKARNSPCNWVGQKKKKKRDKGIGTGPAPLGGSCEGGKVTSCQEAPRWQGREGDSQSQRRAQQ